MRLVLFCHSLVSDWNHGNAHFLRGIVTELLGLGHEVAVYEPQNGWSRRNLLAEAGRAAVTAFRRAYPGLTSTLYDPAALDVAEVLDGADACLVHEWNDPGLVRQAGLYRRGHPRLRLLFHDTHHRLATDPGSIMAFDLRHYDGVLAFGQVIRDLYLEKSLANRAWTWHEAADTRVFRPLAGRPKEADVAFVGNWGDEERTKEIRAFLLEPVRELGLSGAVHGVRYPARALDDLERAGLRYKGWLPNFKVPEAFARHRVTVHVPRGPYARALPGIPTIRVFEALACGIPLVSAPWDDAEGLFKPGRDFLVARTRARMTRLLREILSDADLAASLAAEGRRTILARHTCLHRVREIFASLASSGCRTGAGNARTGAKAARPGARATNYASRRLSMCEIAFFGSSLVSAYWNDAATYYRGIVKALDALGHRVTFFEPDAYGRQEHRDMDEPDWAAVRVYAGEGPEVHQALEEGMRADVVVKASGVGVFDELLESAVLELRKPDQIVIFWDVDAPATLDRVREDPADPFRALIPRYDFILTYGGGQPVVDAYMDLGAKSCVPVYNALDPDTHHPEPARPEFHADLSFLGNRLPDREARVEEFFLKAAKLLPNKTFLIGGNGWSDKDLPKNVGYLGHVYTRDHNALNCSAKVVLNVSRQSMADYGFSPTTRVFEAAGAGACLLTDSWEGIEEFFEPGREVLVAEDGEETAAVLKKLTARKAASIGKAALKRVLAEHTYAHRAAQVDRLLAW